ncbi:MAG: hypothetical protein HZB55_11345 [Deltaproteobacteria bacterium]|nr:hypothetical protein [Deltaproteobacteria bacterium]
MDHYLGVAREKGLTEDEIGAVQAVVMAVSAGRVNAQVREFEGRGRNRRCAAEPASVTRGPGTQ